MPKPLTFLSSNTPNIKRLLQPAQKFRSQHLHVLLWLPDIEDSHKNVWPRQKKQTQKQHAFHGIPPQGVPQTIDDLLNQGHRMVHYMRNFGAKPDGWEYPSGDGYNSLMLPGTMTVNSVPAYHEAGLAGLGLIQGGYSALVPHIKSGALVEVLPTLRPEPLNASFVVAHRRNLSQRVRAFMNWTEEVLKPYFD